MSNEAINFSKIFEESKSSLFSPKEFFAGLSIDGGFAEPVVKAVIYGTLAGIFNFIWHLLNLAPSSTYLGGMFAGGMGIMILIGSIIGAIIAVFLGGLIILVISAICKGNTDFEANLRVSAALMVLSPISAFLSFTGGFSIVLSSILSLAVSLFGLWMLYHALVGSLKAKESSAKIASIVLAVVFALFTIIGMGAKRIAGKYQGNFEELIKEMNIEEADTPTPE